MKQPRASADLRRLQDRFLEHDATAWQVGFHGWDSKIAGSGSPSFAHVRDLLWPEWETWFRDFLGLPEPAPTV